MVDRKLFRRFSRPTRDWFLTSFPCATSAQIGAWEAVSSGRHTLVIAPTGSGKTLAAFLWAIDGFQRRPSTGRTRVLYVSPLKALAVDVEHNLREPLAGISLAAHRIGAEMTQPTVGIRTGDTTPQQRRRLHTNPPDILITTPESLYLLLTSRAAATLTAVETVIIDEVHAIAGNKRGAHLALSLERLDAILDQPAQRIGLSATVEPVAEVARFLGGSHPVTTICPAMQKTWDIKVSVPVADLSTPGAPTRKRNSDSLADPGIWPHIAAQVLALVLENTATLVFTNSRRAAELLTARLNELYAEQIGSSIDRSHQPAATITSGDTHGAPPELARAHHGSVSKDQRAIIEGDLKAGRLRCVVATSSLELGIDMGDVDLVIQIEAPPGVASGLQRIGRAGHQVGAASHGVIIPKNRSDVLACAVTVQLLLRGDIEPLAVPANPLDILAQQTIAAAAVGTLDADTWYETVRRAAPFAALPRSAYDATLDLISGRYPSSEFAGLRARIVWDRSSGTLSGRPGAQRLAVTSGGTIPDRGLFSVYLLGDGDGRRVGELDEQMVHESRIGDVIALGATSWRVEQITHDRVFVTPAFGQPGRLPFWVGDGLGRPSDVGRALGAFQRALADQERDAADDTLMAIGLDPNASHNAISYLAEQRKATGVIPSDIELVVERFTDDLGDWKVVLHSPYGLAVHAPWALAVGSMIRERYGVDGSVMAADDGIVARIPMIDDVPPGAELFVFDPDDLADIVTAEVGGSALFAARFRECASRALLLPRRDPGRRAPLWQQRLRASQLLEVARKFPQFPIILETMRECLKDVYDLPALHSIAGQIARNSIRMVEVSTAEPSPFARSLLIGYAAQHMYDDDYPLAERRAGALSLDLSLLTELLGHTSLRELLEPDVIATTEAELQHLSPDRRLRGIEGAADLLSGLGPLTAAELNRRLIGEIAAEDLVAVGRAFIVNIAGIDRLAAPEDASRLRDGLGIVLPATLPETFTLEVADPLGDLIGRFAATRGPFTVDAVADNFGLPTDTVVRTLERLSATGRLVAGEFTPRETAPQWCDLRVLRKLRHRSLAALRSQIEPVKTAVLGRFLPQWQQVGGDLRGSDGITLVLEQLAGVAAPASAWESFILPARITDYSPTMLDEVLSCGEIVFSGCGRITDSDGWISFHVAADAQTTLHHQDLELTDVQQELVDRLSGGGHFLRDLVSCSDAPIADELWALFWAGRVTNDSFAPLRLLLGSASAHRHTPAPRTRISRLNRLRSGSQVPSLPGGRWSLLARPPADITGMAHARLEYLLDRHGIVTRGAVQAEDFPGGFGMAYQILSKMEERGTCRRGYFVAGLGGAQFGLPSTIDLLRTHSEPKAGSAALTLAATDPANPYGAALDWPAGPGHRPGRRAGALVVLLDGDLVLYLERGGRTVLQYSDDPDVLASAAVSLVKALRSASVPKLAVETVNGFSSPGTGLADALIGAGFYLAPKAIRFRS